MKKIVLPFLACLSVLLLSVGAQAQTLTQSHTLEPGQWTPGQLRFSADGTQLWAAFDYYSPQKWQHAVRSWDAENGAVLSQAVLPGVVGPSLDFSVFSPGGRYYAHRTLPGLEPQKQVPTTIRDTATGTIVSTPEVSNAEAVALAFSPDDKLLAGLSFEKPGTPPVLKTWETATGKAVPLFDKLAETERFSRIYFSADNQFVVRLSWMPNDQSRMQRRMVVFNRDTGEELTAAYLDGTGLSNFALAPDTDKLWDAGAIPVWDTWNFELSPSGFILAGVSADGKSVVLWDTQTGAQVSQLPLKGDATVRRLHFSNDGSQLTVLGTSPLPLPHSRVWKQTWETATGRELAASELPLKATFLGSGTRQNAPVSTTNSRFYAQFTNRETIEIYRLEDGELARRIKVGETAVGGRQ